MKILVLYIPFPLFWALFDQQGSRWTIQAKQMNGYISQQYTIKPDQVQVLNPLIVVFCIPLFNFIIYPMLEKIKINTPLRKMALGMALCGAAFAISGVLEMRLEKTYPVLPSDGEAQMRIFNGQACGFQLRTNLSGHENIQLAPDGMWMEQHIVLQPNESIKLIQYNLTTEEGSTCEPISLSGQFEIHSNQATSYLLAATNKFVEYEDDPMRSKESLPLNRILITSRVENAHLDVINKEIMMQNMISSDSFKLQSDLHHLHELEAGSYIVWVDGNQIGGVELKHGGTYTTIINQISQYNYVSCLLILKQTTIHTIYLLILF